jgi:hypothetical protein
LQQRMQASRSRNRTMGTLRMAMFDDAGCLREGTFSHQ